MLTNSVKQTTLLTLLLQSVHSTTASKLLLDMTILTTSLNMHRWAAINGKTDSIIECVMLCAVTSHCELYCRYSSTGESHLAQEC
eukprot:7984-Heterococcus_DN1.PRE.2